MLGHKKNLHKSTTQKTGDNAEYYLSELFQMQRMPDGNRMPDLRDGDFFIEIKSGINGRAQLVDYELHYTTSKKTGSSFFAQLAENRVTYYDVIRRNDSLTSEELKRPFSNILIDWGDQYIIPSEMVTKLFAIQWLYRPGNNLPINEILSKLEKKISDDASGATITENNKISGVSWQTIESGFLKSIFCGEKMKARSEEKLAVLKEIYPSFDSLERIPAIGPKSTQINILSENTDLEYFNNVLLKKIKSQTPLIEEISYLREESRALLKNISPIISQNLFGQSYNGQFKMNLSQEEIALLKKLSVWKK